MSNDGISHAGDVSTPGAETGKAKIENKMVTDPATVTEASDFSSHAQDATEADPKSCARREEFNKHKLDDIKTAFDSLRNMGICIAMLLGLPTLKNVTPFLPEGVMVLFSFFVMLVVAYLGYANYVWTMRSLKEEPTLECNYKIAKIFLLFIGALVIAAFMKNTYSTLLAPWVTACL